MLGAICRRDILAHPVVTIQCFGWTVFFRAVVSGRKQTFLSLLAETRAIPSRAVEVPESVGQCVELELRAMRIYESLAQRFACPEPAGIFFQTLARQEQEHAELLELCRVAAGHGHWDEGHVARWRQSVPRLQRRMREAESSSHALASLADALRLVIRIESSEINYLFSDIVSACNSDFVKKFAVFQSAARDHILYICRVLPQLEPGLAEACRELCEAQPQAMPRP